MTIPFLDLFKKLAGRFTTIADEVVTPATPNRVAKKPAGERLSKTVMPNATRSFSNPDPFRSAAGATPTRSSAPSLELGSGKVTAVKRKPQTSNLPPALARALEPKLERAISLRIADFMDSIPAGFIKPVEILDAAARVSLKASEIEKGMPEKKPSVSLASLYQQVPEIFLRGVRPDDNTRVELPYDKVLDQFKSTQVRADQQRDPAVPQVDTPILKATIQDSERFGVKIEPIEASSLPEVPVKPATAESIAAAEPDALVQQTAKSTSSEHPVVSLYSPPLKPEHDSPAAKSPSQPSSIPFDLSPNGTGASASERVPASSGPPVPTPLPFLPDLPTIAFQLPVEKPKAKPPAKSPEPPIPTSEKISAPAKDETLISLSLKPILQNLPAFQLNGDVAAVSDEERLTLPLTLIEKQLATGRISVPAEVFQKALPEKHRGLFQLDEAKTPVALSLEEVLKNLPATVLKLRDDQEHLTLGQDFETPFSLKAREDAKRFATKAPAAEKVADKPAAVEPKIDIKAEAEKKIDPKEVVAQTSALKGVKACAITFSDGLSLAGELPKEIAAEGLCAMAPSILERVAEHVGATKLGPLVAVTFYTSDSAVSFFARGNICLSALHAGASLPAQSRMQIAELVEKLSRTYAQPEKPNVDH